MTNKRAGFNAEYERVSKIRDAYAAKVGHVCPTYLTVRSGPPHNDGPSDPALQDGLGCPICYPPDGRYHG
jgi:hypothetical protein